MAVLSNSRLPGIQFAAPPPPPIEVLPRMDVAVFVGFASAGPLHNPVAVEDPAHFASVFGDDLTLAWDPLRCETVSSLLGPAVRAFFRNGGRRCWVIRVPVSADFTAALFLDPALASVGAAALPAAAEAVRFGDGRDLQGIHAALDIDEATLIAVPDAVHRGWLSDDPPAPVPPGAPEPLPNPHPGEFLDCGRSSPPAPTLMVVQGTPPGGFTLSWTSGITDSNLRFLLEEATTPNYDDAATVSEGTGRSVAFYGHRPGNYYYRVRVDLNGVSSAWSQGVVVTVAPRPTLRLKDPAAYARTASESPLFGVQRALLRLCAARGDMLAVLALPEHYRETDAQDHARALSNLDTSEPGLVNYGGVYHPWLIGRKDATDPLRRTPPDGAACGILARRARARGAWVAPANEALSGVVALDRPAAFDSLLDLQDAQVNVVRQDPRGFVCLSADTLSRDDDLRPMNVRRLLMLLRRLAVRLGATYAFEPNDESLRRTVQRGFESILGYLFERGAFAGDTLATSFQVVATAPEESRLVVELRVAPSRPLTFLIVRLVQTGDQGIVTEGR